MRHLSSRHKPLAYLAVVLFTLGPALAATAQMTDRVITRNGDQLTGEVKSVASGRLEFKTDATAISVALGEIAQIERIRGSFWSRLKGSVDLGFTLNKANNRTDLTFKLTGSYRTRQGAWHLSYDTLYRRQDNTDDLDRQDLTGNYQRFLGGNWILTAFAAGQRSDYGATPGIGYSW